MKTITNATKMLLNLVWGAYIATLTVGALWLMYQPEPSLTEVPGFAMVVGQDSYGMGTGGIFCAYGMAWYETEVMGVNALLTEDGKLFTCYYTKNVDDWAYRMGPVSEYTDL